MLLSGNVNGTFHAKTCAPTGTLSLQLSEMGGIVHQMAPTIPLGAYVGVSVFRRVCFF